MDIDSVRGLRSQEVREEFELEMSRTVDVEENDGLKGTMLYDNLHKFLQANPESEMSGEYLASLSSFYDNYLSGVQIEALTNMIDKTYQTKNDLNKIRGIIEQKVMFEVGNVPPDIVLPDVTGKMVDRSRFIGKIVLLEFWASWCAPYRQSNSELLNIHEFFNSKGFDILGVSIDRNIEESQSAVKEDKLGWTQVIDTISITEKTFNLTSIPFNLLLDRVGKIITKNIKPIELNNILCQRL